MKLSNAQILGSIASLSRLMSQPIPISISFKLKKLKKELDPIIEIVNENIKEINEKFVVKNDKGENVQVVDNSGKVVPDYFMISDEGVAERRKLDIIENEVNVEPIKVSDLPAATMLSEFDLEVLDWLLVE